MLQRLLLIARSFAEYLLVIVWPFGTLSPIHFSALPIAANDGLAWLSVVIGVASVAGLIYWIRRAPRSGWLALAAAVSLLPVLNIIPLNLTGGAFVAERFLVFPLALLVLAISGPLASWAFDSHRLGRTVVFGLWCVACIVMIALTTPRWSMVYHCGRGRASVRRNRQWRGATLANEDVQRGDYSDRPASGAARARLERCRRMGLEQCGTGAVRAGPLRRSTRAVRAGDAPRALQCVFWNNLGGVFLQQGQWLEAEQNLLKALDIDPNEPLAHLNLGTLYLNVDRPDQAIPHLQTAVRLLPADQVARAQTLLDRANQPDAWMRLVDQQLTTAECQRGLAGAG